MSPGGGAEQKSQRDACAANSVKGAPRSPPREGQCRGLRSAEGGPRGSAQTPAPPTAPSGLSRRCSPHGRTRPVLTSPEGSVLSLSSPDSAGPRLLPASRHQRGCPRRAGTRRRAARLRRLAPGLFSLLRRGAAPRGLAPVGAGAVGGARPAPGASPPAIRGGTLRPGRRLLPGTWLPPGPESGRLGK